MWSPSACNNYLNLCSEALCNRASKGWPRLGGSCFSSWVSAHDIWLWFCAVIHCKIHCKVVRCCSVVLSTCPSQCVQCVARVGR